MTAGQVVAWLVFVVLAFASGVAVGVIARHRAVARQPHEIDWDHAA